MSEHSASLTAHAPELLRYFRRRVPDFDAPDLLAETLLTAWRRETLLPNDPIAARMWLFGIAHHILHKYNRGERRRVRLAARLRETLTTTCEPPADSGIEVRDAIQRLPSHLAEVVRLVHWEGFSVAQAAGVLQIPASTARNHYQRAKSELRIALQLDSTTAAAVDS